MKKISIAMSALMGLCLFSAHGDMQAVRERLKNDPYMVPFYTGEILPRPQEVAYGNEFYPLDRTGILAGQGIEPDDPRLKILLDRIARYGGNCRFVDSLKDNDCTTVFVVGDIAPAKDLEIPENAQGYAVKCFERDGKHVVALNARDRVGLTWAVNSLVQMITLRDDKTVIHSMDVFDFPFMLRRGSKGPGLHKYVEASILYPVMTKLDWIHFSKSMLVPRRGKPREWIDWRTPRPKQLTDKVRAIGANLKGLGICWEVGIMPFAIGDTINQQVQVDSKGDEHFDIVWKMCEPVLEAGGGICYTPDDYRFPVSTADMINFGTAREADIYFLNRLYKKIKAGFPDATMSLVQPFYHGPRTRNPWSDESPIDYLKAIGERLPKDIGICWTGPSVKTGWFTREHVDLMTSLIGRKPYFFQNTSDQEPAHIYRYVYPTDTMQWWLHTHRDVNVYKELNGAIFNSLGFYPDMLWSAMLWNPNEFDAEDAAYQATCKLVGMENYDIVTNLVGALSYLDKYYVIHNGKPELYPSREAARDVARIEKHLSEARELSEKYNNSMYAAAATNWASLAWTLRITENFYATIMEEKKFALYRAAKEQEERAQTDMQLSRPYVFLAACDFKGGNLEYTSTLLTEDKRPVTTLSGHEPAGIAEFEIPPDVPDGCDMEVIVSAKMRGGGENVDPLAAPSDDGLGLEVEENDSKIGVYLNGQKVFEGKPPFASDEWMRHCFVAPGELLVQGTNTLAIKVLNHVDKQSVDPVISLNYAVIMAPASE